MSGPHLFACPRPQVHISHLDPASLSWVGHHVGSTTGGVCLHLDSEERAPRASPVMQNHCKKRTFIGVFGSNYKLNVFNHIGPMGHDITLNEKELHIKV